MPILAIILGILYILYAYIYSYSYIPTYIYACYWQLQQWKINYASIQIFILKHVDVPVAIIICTKWPRLYYYCPYYYKL